MIIEDGVVRVRTVTVMAITLNVDTRIDPHNMTGREAPRHHLAPATT
jgi:hypothetical protein